MLFKSKVHYILVYDSFAAAAVIANWFYNYPSASLTVIGVTGTNGKTTVATLLWQALQYLGCKTGLISTVSYNVGNRTFNSDQTTPDAVRLTKLFYEMKIAGCRYVVMEVSSHGIFEKRIAGILFQTGIFTNLSTDHLDFHQSMQAYKEVKKSFFSSLSPKAIAITNLDDQNGSHMCESTSAKTVTYGIHHAANYKAQKFILRSRSTSFELNGQTITTNLIGKFNLSNCLAVAATLCELGFSEHRLQLLFRKLRPPKGRMDFFNGPKGRTAIIDYAHNPDGLESLLSVAKGLKKKRAAVILIFGCGGNRDKIKRPLMGSVAESGSDYIFLTADNPRFENPADICKEIAKGIQGTAYEVIIDREDAIKAAIRISRAHDIIVLAGKGHEEFQIIGDRIIPYSDKNIIINEFKLLAGLINNGAT